MRLTVIAFVISAVFWLALLLAIDALAAHSIHNWQLYDIGQTNTGRSVCSWLCETMNENHTTVTYGHGGRCPRPW